MPSWDALRTPLAEVTFVVIDLETTGGSPHTCEITEVGALKVRGGEVVATFETLVDPGIAIPFDVTYLTGITEATVAAAPRVESVLPALLEFIGDAVIVGHNVAFDLAFLRADLARLGYRPLTNASVDTCVLARRLLRDEIDDCRLGTVARHLGTEVTPCHRAMADAQATGEVLHRLLERVASLGVTALDDLLALPRTSAHAQVAKLHWVDALPRSLGVYAFTDGAGQVIHVGRATDLRQRVRSYFASDDRRRVGPMLREAQGLRHHRCAHELEAIALEARLIREHAPRYNLEVDRRRKYRYVRTARSGGKATVTREVRDGDRHHYVGPFASTTEARAYVAAEAGGAAAGATNFRRRRARQQRVEALVRAGRLEVEFVAGGGAVLVAGRLEEIRPAAAAEAVAVAGGSTASRPCGSLPVTLDLFDEVDAVAAWLDQHAHHVRIVRAESGWWLPQPDAYRSCSSSATFLCSAAAAASTTSGGVPLGSWNDSGPAAAPSSPTVASPS